MKPYISLTLFLFGVLSVMATKNKNESDKKNKTGTLPVITAGCSPATAATDLDINNIRALIQTGGDMWWDLRGAAKYEIPKNSGTNALFAGALWLGGKDVSGQLKVAAQRFRSSGNDFWTGPLSTVNFDIDATTCNQYDRHFVTLRSQVEEFVAWYEAGEYDKQNNTNTQANDFPNYQIPKIIVEWPAHGRNYNPYNEDFYLAPFHDRNGDGIYNPLDGDYPGYDLKGETDCAQRIVNIYGDKNLWWVFNDKGNVHTETGAAAIGLEIRAQAFAFATNDEVNNMTFYNYEIVNRSSYTLTDTYFGQWIDPDIGNPYDDFVGCDVMRGLGYCYNGNEVDIDNAGAKGYGAQPPAIGVDFFQGPYQDNDGLDNPGPKTNTEILPYNIAFSQNGIPYKGIGVGYGDGIIDNERLGMRKFLYYNNDLTVFGEPEFPTHYYNYLTSFWRDNTRMVYGGKGHEASVGANPNVKADYMFPGDTDPIGWGTGGTVMPSWTEAGAGNSPWDRRFIQSAGPFTLAPGAVNNVTVGVVWARATTGGAWGSVLALRKADDKTQAMFDNCFKVLNGPDAPELSFQELDRELIIYISNKNISNNLNESYSETDPFLIAPDSADTNNDGLNDYSLTEKEKENYSTYRFQGYMIYQLKNQSVSAADLKNPDLARLVAQCDIKDSIKRIINFYFDESLNANVPVEEVNGNNDGVYHSFRITDDAFASGDKRLVNHKKVYYMAVAYAYNFSPYNEYDPNNPAKLTGQTRPFLASRKSASGAIKVFGAIPHIPSPESGGTYALAEYGDEIPLTRIEGKGNGGRAIYMTKKSMEEALSAPEYRVKHPVYEKGYAPVKIKIIDPLNVPAAEFTFIMLDSITRPNLSDAYWVLKKNGTPSQEIYSNKTVQVFNEQLVPEWGLSVSIEQANNPRTSLQSENYENDFIESKITFTNHAEKWLTGVPDADGMTPQNWIRCGKTIEPSAQQYNDWDNFNSNGNNTINNEDQNEAYEKILGGTWAPFKMAAKTPHGPVPADLVHTLNKLKYLESVDIVITPDKSKWSRCPVIEMQENKTLSQGGAEKCLLRASSSVDKNGLPDGSGTGMGWFPGYAVNIETGERLNIAFGEDSWLTAENGADMIWNPTHNIFEGPFNEVRFGGKHYIIVFRNNVVEDAVTGGIPSPQDRMPAYDEGEFIRQQLSNATSVNSSGVRNVYRAAMWVGLPLMAKGFTLKKAQDGLVPSEVIVSIRVSRAYETYGTGKMLNPSDLLTVGQSYYVDKGPVSHNGVIYNHGEYFTAVNSVFSATGTDTKNNLSATINAGRPIYTFNTFNMASQTQNHAVATEALKIINVVPNPYYAYSEYENDKVDNRIKITNLPHKCSISIYTVSGVLVRKLEKDDPTITSIDWDLKNHARIPVSSGIYLIHVEVPGVGERILKWFGVMRPVDLDSF